MCMSGAAPFSANSDVKTLNNIMTCNYEYKTNEWEGVSSNAKNWISKLFEPDPKQRMTAE